MEEKRRVVCLSLLFAFLAIAFSPLTFSSTNAVFLPQGDELDQQQIECDGELACLFDDEFAQGFVPTMDTLTRIELYIARNETVVPGLEIAIRNRPFA